MTVLGMGMPPAGGPPAGLPASIQIGGGPPVGPGEGKSDGDWEQDLSQAIAALHELEGDATDHQEALVIAQCVAQLRKLSAARQSGAESALGITASHKAMSRAYGG